MIDFVINITTCNRPKQLEQLLDQIESEKGKYEILVNVYEDRDEEQYNFDVYSYVKWHETNIHFGKRRYWELINTMFNDLKKFEASYYLFIPDDFMLKKGFFKELDKAWKAIPEKIAILPYMPKSRHCSCWNNFYPVRKMKFQKVDYLNVGYIDMNFMCDKTLLQQLNYRIDKIESSRWDNDPTLSSGVGRQITYRAIGKMYLHIKGLQTQVKHKSIMNPDADCSYPHL